MGCNCKSNKTTDEFTSETNKITTEKVIHYTLKFIGFLLLVIMLPIINLVIIWFMFRLIVLNKDVDIKAFLVAIYQKFKVNETDDEDDLEDINDLSEDDLIMENVEDITYMNK